MSNINENCDNNSEISFLLKQVLNKLENLEKRIENIEKSSSNMDKHINFVENIYESVQIPFNKLIGYVNSSSSFYLMDNGDNNGTINDLKAIENDDIENRNHLTDR